MMVGLRAFGISSHFTRKINKKFWIKINWKTRTCRNFNFLFRIFNFTVRWGRILCIQNSAWKISRICRWHAHFIVTRKHQQNEELSTALSNTKCVQIECVWEGFHPRKNSLNLIASTFPSSSSHLSFLLLKKEESFFSYHAHTYQISP